MANLKIKVGAATSTPIEIQRLRRGRVNGYSNIRPIDYSNYEKASNQFDSTIKSVDGILFLFNKTVEELKTIYNDTANEAKIIFNIKGIYNNNIKKIEVTTLKNKFIFPNGNQLLYPDRTVNYNQDIAGIAGEYGFGTRNTPIKEQNDVMFFPVSTLFSGIIIDFFAKVYEPLCFIHGHKNSERNLEFAIRLLDNNDNPINITTYEFFGSSLERETTSLITKTDLGAASDIFEKKYDVIVNDAIQIKRSRLDIIDTLDKGYIKIETLPIYGTLKLNGIDVTIGKTIGVEQLNNNELIYTPTTSGVVDYIDFSNGKTSVETSWWVSRRVFFFNIIPTPK